MISTVKKEIAISNELHSKIEWACTFSDCEPKIKNGNLRMVEKTNIAYVEPHSVGIKGKLHLFFNEHELLKKELDINYMDLGEYYFHKDKIDENYDTKTQVAKIRNRAIEFKLKKNQKVIHNFIFYFDIIRSN